MEWTVIGLLLLLWAAVRLRRYKQRQQWIKQIVRLKQLRSVVVEQVKRGDARLARLYVLLAEEVENGTTQL